MRQRVYPSQKAARLIARVTIATTQAAVQGASAAAAADEAVAGAVSGDLVTENPYISAKIAEIEARIDDLEPPP